jgi:hypothetical protein
LAHIALDEALEDKPIPVWFHEGYAAYVAGDNKAPRAQVLVMAALQQRLLSVAEMNAQFPPDAPESSLAYAQAADIARFLSEKPNQTKFTTLLEKRRKGEPFEMAVEIAYGSSFSTVEDTWHSGLARRYGFLPVFLGAMAVWAFCAAMLFLRRFLEQRKTRPDKPSREDAPLVAEIEHVSAVDAVVARAERMPVPDRGESTGATIPLETEVPKVEHEGDWFTLH